METNQPYIPHTKGKSRTTNKLPDAQVRFILRLYNSGLWTYRELSEKYDISLDLIRRILTNEYTLQADKPTATKRKIDDQQIKRVLELKSNGMTHRLIAENIGISSHSVAHYCRIAKANKQHLQPPLQ